MDRPQPSFDVEAALGKLMPRGLGEDARIQLETVIDELSAESRPSRLNLKSRLIHLPALPFPQTVAALLCCGFLGWGAYAVSMDGQRSSSAGYATIGASNQSVPASEPEIEVLTQSVWIDGGENLGIRPVNEAGDTRQGWSYHGVEEERLLHGDSGYEVVVQREFEGQHFANTTL
jgi:hypothetical protein